MSTTRVTFEEKGDSTAALLPSLDENNSSIWKDGSGRMTITDSAFNPDLVYQLSHYLTPINFFCAMLVILLIPTFLIDTEVLNQIDSEAHVIIIFILLVVIVISIGANNILLTALQNILIDTSEVQPYVGIMSAIMIAVSLSTVYYNFGGWSVFMQILFRFELSFLVLYVVYLQLVTKAKTTRLLKSFIIYRDTLEMIEEDRHLPVDNYDVEVKKQRIVDKKPQLLFLQRTLTSKLLLSCVVVVLLVALGFISFRFWKEKIRFMIFLYVSFTTPIVFSTHQITHYNEKIMAIESDLRIRTFLRVRLFGWVPRRELIFGTIVSLGVNAIRVFVPL